MHYHHKFAIVGFIIGLVPIILGIIALTTPAWITINNDRLSDPIVYDLFTQCKTNGTVECTDINFFGIPQYLEIIGYTILIFGCLVGVLCTALIDNRSIHFIAPVIIIVGTIMIFFGFIYYIKSVVELTSTSLNMNLYLGYSMILMVSTCIIGCILIAYFSFSAGYIHRHILATVNIH